MSRILLFAISVLIFSGCFESYYFKDEVVFFNDAWQQADLAEFEVAMTDTSRLYNLFVDLEHSTDYPYENVYVFIRTQTPAGAALQKRINIDMADKAGKWHGKCSSKSCKLRIKLQSNAYFDTPGNYSFAFEQYMRIDPLAGINKLTFLVEDTGLTR
ncbi:MAG: gliding motility lipoprotein GldH [Bacteroidota bacterium]